MAYPDRLSCGASLLAAQGLRRIAVAQVPATAGHVDLVIGDGEQAVRLQGVAYDGVMREFEAWTLGCGR